MYTLHVTARVKPGGEEQYETWKREQGKIQRRAPGFLKRLLLKDKQNPGTYCYISFWETEEQCRAFSSSADFVTTHTRIDPQAALSAPLDLSVCDVVLDEVVEGDLSPSTV